MDNDRPQIRDLGELERYAGIERNVEPAFTRRQIEQLERKMLGRTWGKKRRKMQGWPK